MHFRGIYERSSEISKAFYNNYVHVKAFVKCTILQTKSYLKGYSTSCRSVAPSLKKNMDNLRRPSNFFSHLKASYVQFHTSIRIDVTIVTVFSSFEIHYMRTYSFIAPKNTVEFSTNLYSLLPCMYMYFTGSVVGFT